MCPPRPGRWVDVFFAGDAWSEAQRQAVLRELRTELQRRSVQLCHRTRLPLTPADDALTLVAIDPDHVRIVPTRLNGERAWQSGRTMALGNLPEDARPLTIALSADEVLRSQPRRDVHASDPVQARAAQKLPPREYGPRGVVALGVGARGGLASGSGPRKSPLWPALELRTSLTQAGWGGSLGTALGTSTEWSFNSNRFNLLRLPFDLSANRVVQLGEFEAALDAGLVVSYLKLESLGSGRSFTRAEAGARLGVRVSWGRTLAPFLGSALEWLPVGYDLQLVPDGSVGHTAHLWLGLSVGLEARFQ